MNQKRNNRLVVDLNTTEQERLDKAIDIFGCSKSFFVRSVLNSALDNVFNLKHEQISFRFFAVEQKSKGGVKNGRRK